MSQSERTPSGATQRRGFRGTRTITRSTCRVCGSERQTPLVDYGQMPLAGGFLSQDELAYQAAFPLRLARCVECTEMQILDVVPPAEIFTQYSYVSSTTRTLIDHFAEMGCEIVAAEGAAGRLVVEFGCNDGVLVRPMLAAGARVVGVDPSDVAFRASQDGRWPLVQTYFDDVAAAQVKAEYGPARIVTGNNVFAHVDDVHGFLEGVDACLAEDGVFIIEVPYLADFLEKLEFDTIYHEHLSYVSLAPMERLCAMHDFELVDVERASLHGGSIVLHMRRKGVGTPSGRLRQMIDTERGLRLSEPLGLASFVEGVRLWKVGFETLVDELVGSGATLIGYGAAAKANTLLNYCPRAAMSLQMILDRSPHKHGRYTPGTHIKVEPVERWQSSGATHMVILAWNFQNEIMRQMKAFEDRGGRFVVPIPAPQVV